MAKQLRQQQRSLARVDKQPSAGSIVQVEDPVGIGPDRMITIDMAKLPTPVISYDADFAWIEHRPGDLRLFFGKRSKDKPETLRTRLELRYPPEGLIGHFWRNSRDFHQKMSEFAGRWPKDQARDSVNPAEMTADKEHSEWANFEAMSHAGTEALIDFYTLPVSGIAKFAAGQGSSGLTMMPVVRVQMTIFELTRLLDSMSSIVTEIENYLPQGSERRYEPIERPGEAT
jgi:hypothetical protein